MKLTEGIYRAAIRLFPRNFREQFGNQMCAAFRDAAAPLSPAGRARLLGAELAGLMIHGVAERWSAARASEDMATNNGTRNLRNHSRGIPPMQSAESVWQDVRFATRSLLRRPGMVATIVATLALGIGANTAIFSVIDSVLLHPLSIAQPERVVAVYERLNAKTPHGGSAFPVYKALAAQTKTFSGLAAFLTLEIGMRAGSYVEQGSAAPVSGNYFSVLGVQPIAGRLLTPEDDNAPGAHPVAVLSDALWKRAFNRQPGAIGSVIYLGGNPFTVIGVAPASFRGTRLESTPRLWVPLTMLSSIGAGEVFSKRNEAAYFSTPFSRFLYLVGRLKPAATATQATAELNALYPQIQKSFGERAVRRATIPSPMLALPVVQAAALGDRENLTRFVAMLIGVVVLTLLIACMNVANLLFVRATERARELGVRVALGASRWRIVRQLFIESALLALAGAVTGIAVCVGTMRLLSSFTLPGNISLGAIGLSLDTRVLAFTAILAVVTALLFGLAPSLRASKHNVVTALKSGFGSSRRSSRGALVGAQVALSLLLLVGAGLFIRSLRAGLTTDVGFDPRPLAAISVNLGLDGYTPATAEQYYRNAMERARRIPGVTEVAVGEHLPLSSILTLPFTDGASIEGPQSPKFVGLVPVSPEYFSALRLPLRDGRFFTVQDDAHATQVIVANQSAARAFSPNASPLGHVVNMFGKPYTIVGVVADTKYESVRDAERPVFFVPLAQNVSLSSNIIVRSSNPAAALEALRRELRAIDPTIPLRDARLVASQIDNVLMPQRFGATLLGIFAAVALVVSAVGIHGVIAFGVKQREQEIGIRLALGARNHHVVRLVLERTLVAIGVGVTVGLSLSLVASRALARFLYGIAPVDWQAYVAAIVVLTGAALVACWVPTMRATRLDLMNRIRAE